MSTESSFEGWAICELMGHNIIAGYCTEQVTFGAAMLRVQVPAVNGKPAFDKFFNPSSIYAVTPTTEEHARQAAEQLRVRPVTLWVVPDRPALPVADEPYMDGFEDDEDGDSGF